MFKQMNEIRQRLASLWQHQHRCVAKGDEKDLGALCHRDFRGVTSPSRARLARSLSVCLLKESGVFFFLLSPPEQDRVKSKIPDS
jgi:hypothetical protein